MDEAAIAQQIEQLFHGVDVVIASKENGAPEVSWGDRFFFYDPERKLPSDGKFPFATIVTKDYGDFDKASNLNRPGVFRLNIGVGKATFQSMFGQQPSGHDFTALDKVMPHPVYGTMFWVCVLNPSQETFAKIQPLLKEAYDTALRSYSRRNP